MTTIPRFVPPGGELQSIVIRCFQSRFLLTPCPRVNQLIVGALARAQERTGVKVFHAVFLSNHAHLLVEVKDARQRAEFMHFADTNIAREVGGFHGWSGKFWAERYSPSIVSLEETCQISALRYLLSQSVKEHLVEQIREWPGLHTGALVAAGLPVKGVWVDRTGLYKARRTAKGRARVRPSDFEHQVELELSPLPCWADLPATRQRELLCELIQEVEQDAASERRSLKLARPLGRARILSQQPTHRPSKTAKSPARWIYAASQEMKQQYIEALKIFHRAYRQAAERLKAGVLDAVFPDGCFPPPRRFVEMEPVVPGT